MEKIVLKSSDIGRIAEEIKFKIGEQLLEEQKKINEQKRFFISDTHFNDERLNLYARNLLFKNAEEVNEHIIKTWNNTVGENDLVYHLGDVSMDLKGLEILNKLNGKKILIKGNYDIPISEGGTSKFEINDKVLLKYFSKVYDELEITIGDKNVYLNHFPVNTKEDVFCIVGHIHGLWKCQRNAINVGVDCWHFTPVSEDLIKFQMGGIKNHYDQNFFAGELISNVMNKKGEVKILRAPEIYKTANVDGNEDVFVFLAGPIQGSKNWQEEFIKEIEEEFKEFKSNKNIVICSPRRDKDMDKSKFVYQEQVDWETLYLEKSSKYGIIVFWLAKEFEKIEGRSYAQTSRFELGEWLSKWELNPKLLSEQTANLKVQDILNINLVKNNLILNLKRQKNK
jgi:calcineurin-like phosphoesterase family protein